MIIIECEHCGKQGTRKQRNKNNIYYCNASCQLNYAYENGLRDNFQCQICGINENDCKQNLQIHHIVPFKCTQDNSDDNLITVCSKCHPKIEGKFYKIKSISKKHYSGSVYNLSVKDDETYTANNVVVHNCRTTLRFTREEN